MLILASNPLDHASGLTETAPHFTLGLLHELRGQLSVIENCGSMLGGAAPEGFSRDRILELHRIATRQLHDLLHQLENAENTFGTLATRARKRVLTLRLVANLIDGARIRHPSRAIRVRLPLRLPPVAVDWPCLSSVISNLLENALKYSRADVHFHVACDRDHVRIFVHDRGRGIPAAELGQVLDPFYRASNASDASGSGLGLFITKRATDRIGARLRIVSRENHGTSVLVSLPRCAPGRPRNQFAARRRTNAR